MKSKQKKTLPVFRHQKVLKSGSVLRELRYLRRLNLKLKHEIKKINELIGKIIYVSKKNEISSLFFDTNFLPYFFLLIQHKQIPLLLITHGSAAATTRGDVDALSLAARFNAAASSQ